MARPSRTWWSALKPPSRPAKSDIGRSEAARRGFLAPILRQACPLLNADIQAAQIGVQPAS